MGERDAWQDACSDRLGRPEESSERRFVPGPPMTVRYVHRSRYRRRWAENEGLVIGRAGPD